MVSCALALTVSCSDDDEAGGGGSPSSEAVDATAPTNTDTSAPTTTRPAMTTTGPAAATTTAAETPVTAAPTDQLTVETSSGAVHGADSAVAGVRQFLAIPYAAPPVGERRWRPPEPAPSWTEPLDATAPGASCPQSSEGVTAAVTVMPAWNEDCLTLSVWTPHDAVDLPVMVWFHGGGLTEGSAHQPLYIGDHLADRGVVVVNVNYRLGALGFLATDGLAAEGGGAFGNYGLADQVAALHWVADNVQRFGGDADNVTIFGESAGGFSVCAHLASAASAGLFDRAIVQSGGGCDQFQPAAEAVTAGTAFLEANGCADLACLRAAPAEQLLATSFSPALVADGTILTTTALDQATAGTVMPPVLIGSNADEATLFTIGAPEPTEQDLLDAAAMTGGDPAAVLELYPPEQFPSGLARLQALITDTAFACPTLAFAAASPASFVYHYTYVSASDPFGLGATHGAELVLLFGHPEGIRGLEGEPDSATVAVSEGIRQAWVAFATTGDPGWANFGPGGEIRLLDDPLTSTTEIRDGRCAGLAGLTP